jgi:chromosome segregation ATPase
MGLDRGEVKTGVSCVDDRSQEYVQKLKDDVAVLKQKISDLRFELAEISEKRDIAQSVHVSAMLEKESAYSVILRKIKDADARLSSLTDAGNELVLRQSSIAGEFEAKMKANLDEGKARIEAMNADKANAEKSLAKIVNEIVAKTAELESLEKECESLKALNASLASMNTDLDGKVKEQEIAIAEARKAVPAIESAISTKRAEVDRLAATAEAKAEDLNRIQNQLKDLQAEKDAIAVERDKNTKRAKELSNMANELKTESLALSNKNAMLNKKEAALREAQAKI